MVDLSPLLSLLAGLGPWGLVVGAGITLALQWLAKRRNPNAPVDPVKPVDPNAPPESKTPILDAILNLLKLKLLKKESAPQFQAVAPACTDCDADDELVKKLLAVLLDSKK